MPISYTKVSELNQKFDGALMDLGISSDQLDTPAGGSGRGFSFKNSDDPLDLRFDATDGLTAAQFLNRASIKELEHVFRDFAEDRYWRGLSARIIENRKNVRIETVNDFIALVGNGSPTVLAPLFQALRIQVNQELENLDLGLTEVSKVLKVGAVLAVISFHSLEDRIVKHFFRTDAWEILTKKPIAPSHQEITRNPRSRSAKLRIARLILLESGIS